MIAVDTNILVYASIEEAPWHAAAQALVRGLIEGSTGWAIPWPCIYEFFAVVTNPRIFKSPSPPERALEHIGLWHESPHLNLLSETPTFFPTFKDIVLGAGVVAGAVHDARIAALCLHHGITTLYTVDRDFSRFPRLKVQNPLR